MSAGKPNYSLIPEHCRDGVRDYIEKGHPVGDFLTAIFQNSLVHSFAMADDTNIEKLKDYAQFLYWETPSEAWGSPAKVTAWIERGGMKGAS